MTAAASSAVGSRRRGTHPAPLRDVWRGAVVRAAWTAAARGAGFAATVVIARSLPPAEAGLFFFAMAAAGFLGPVMALGLPPAVARLAAGSDPGGRAALLRKALATELGVGAAAVAALLGAWMAGLDAPEIGRAHV